MGPKRKPIMGMKRQPSEPNTNQLKKTSIKSNRRVAESHLIGGLQAGKNEENPWAVLVIQAELKQKKGGKKNNENKGKNNSKRVRREAGKRNNKSGKVRK